MSKMKKDEIQILKCVSLKVSDDVAMLVTLQYHTEINDEGRVDRSKSFYRWLARVDKIADIEARAIEMTSDAKRFDAWKWPDDPSWNGKIYTKDSNNKTGGDWLKIKMKKLESWEQGQKHLNGWVKCHNEFQPSAKYEIDDYVDPDGNLVSLADRETLLKLVGKNLHKIVQKKNKNSKAIQNAAIAEVA